MTVAPNSLLWTIFLPLRWSIPLSVQLHTKCGLVWKPYIVKNCVVHDPTQLLHHGRDILPTWDKSTTGNVALRVLFWVLVLSRSCKEQLLSFWWWVAPPKTQCLCEESLEWKEWGMEFLLSGDLLTSTIGYKEVKSGAFGTQKAWLIYYWECTKNSKVHCVSDIIPWGMMWQYE